MSAEPWKPLGDVIPQVLRSWQRKVHSPLHRVLEHWQGIVGAEVAKHATPYSVRGKVLTVLVDNTVWGAELAGFHAQGIVSALNNALGSKEIKTLRCLDRRTTRRETAAGEKHAGDPNEI
jgi:predicted nucleic acid-binding Zn ribbon protein